MKTILVPTDFSEVSVNAAYYAAEMAGRFNKKLALLHVSQLPLVATEVPYPAYNMTTLLDAAETDMKDLREKLQRKLSGPVEILTEVTTGDVLTEINRYGADLDVYAVVMGITGSAGEMGRRLFGSKTLEALKDLDFPLIIVPQHLAFTSINRIGIASDFRNVSTKIHFYDIQEFIKGFHASVHVLNIKLEKDKAPNGKPADEFRIFRDLMSDFHPVYHVVERNDIEGGIFDLVKSEQIDLLIVMPGRHTGWDQLFHKSHTRKLVLDTPVPILAIHE